MSKDAEQLQAPLALDLGLCKACGICIALCPEHVFDATDMGEPVIARPGDCSSCLLCELHCPDFAIEVRRRARKDQRAEEAPEESHEAHAGRVYAALATQSKAEAPHTAAEDEDCVGRHEEH